MKTIQLTEIRLFGDVKISVNPDHIIAIEPVGGDTLVTVHGGKEYVVVEKEEDIRKLIADCEAKPVPPEVKPTPPAAAALVALLLFLGFGAKAQINPPEQFYTNYVDAVYTAHCFGGLYLITNYARITDVSSNTPWGQFTNAQYLELNAGCPNESNNLSITWTWGKRTITTNFQVFTMGGTYYTWTPYNVVRPLKEITVIYTDGFFGTPYPPSGFGNVLQDSIYGWKNYVDYSDVVYHWNTNFLIMTNSAGFLDSMNFSADSQSLMRPHGYGLEYIYILRTNTP